MKKLFENHLSKRLEQTYEIMEAHGVDHLFIESGSPDYYFLDDQPTAFRSNPHFLFYCPGSGEGHILHIEKSKKPKLYFNIPNDIWHETSSLKGEFWEDFFEIEVINDFDKKWDQLKFSGKAICISPFPEKALSKGCQEPSIEILNNLHWIRTSKTDYEISCIKQANKIAAEGHKAARKAFLEGKSELGIFQNYLAATGMRETELPYGAIVGLDEKAAVLHYQYYRKTGKGQTFLIDAGAKHLGYCSDITRTHYTDKTHSLFKTIHAEMDKLQQSLCDLVKPGFDYKKVQEATANGVANILVDSGILKTDLDTVKSKNLTDYFYPHGVGHPIGLQVHDVGGKQLNEKGDPGSPNPNYPYLRTLRNIQANDVLTIEPGLYFIPKHLKSLDGKAEKDLFNWKLIEELTPMGGIRIEDNVVASNDGPINLTREFLPN